MSLRVILLFAAVALLFSSPMLFKDKGDSNQSELFSTQANLSTGNGFNFENGFTNPNIATGSPFTNVTGSGVPAQNATTVIGNNTATLPPTASVSPFQFSDPVYEAFFDFNEFLRFDISPAWVKTRWPRVSSFRGEDGLTALRVALVSGPRPVDIHGSLSYYFDDQQRVQRIGFKGWTGDASEIVRIVQQMGLTRQRTNGAGLFKKSSWGRNKGVLRLDHPPVIQRSLPNEQLMVMFELTNPNGGMNVSGQTSAIVDAMEKGR